MANPGERLDSPLMTPPQPNRIKRAPEASPFTSFLKHLPNLSPPRSSTYGSSTFSSLAFTLSPGPPRLASQQTPAKPRGGEAEGEGPPFANILALADIKATPVKAEADAEGLGSYRGSETPFGLRSPIPLFHESPRRPGPSPASSRLPPPPADMGRELREMGRAALGPLGSPPQLLHSSAFAALLDGHSRSSPGGGGGSERGAGAGAAGTHRSYSALFSPANTTHGESSLGGLARAGSGGDRGGAAESAPPHRSGRSVEEGGGRLGGGALPGEAGSAAAALDVDGRGGGGGGGQPALSRGLSAGGGAAGSGARSVPPPPPFFSPTSNPLERGGSLQSVGGLEDVGGVGPATLGLPGGAGSARSGLGGSGGSEDSYGGQGQPEEEDEDTPMVDDAEDADYDEGSDAGPGVGGGRLSRAARAGAPRRLGRRGLPPPESPRLLRRAQPAGAVAYRGGAGPGPARQGPSADSLAAGRRDYATDDDFEPAQLVHALLPQSPMCVPLNLDTLLPIPKLRHSDSQNGVEGDDGSPKHRRGIAPLQLDSPAVKAATNAAITAALEAAVGPASSSGASGSVRSAREGRGSAAAARAAAAAAAAGGAAPLTRRSSHTSGRQSQPLIQPAVPQSDEALMAHMLANSNKKCNCKKSKCLKLYCDCFAGGGFCGPQCSCAGCSNRPDNMPVVKAAREQIASRNPNAFKEKIEADPSLGGQHRRGCNCRKSHCMKKYCECFSAGVPCGEHCKCEGCHNTQDAFRRTPPGGRGRRGGAAATAAAAPPPPPGAAATAAAMRAAGAIPILIPTGAAGSRAAGMAMAGAVAAAARSGPAAAAGARGLAGGDASAALTLGGGALQFLLPLAQQQQQQQAAAAGAAAAAAAPTDSATTPRATSEPSGASDSGAAAAAMRHTTPSPTLLAGATGGTASPQVLQLLQMINPSAGAAGGQPAPAAPPPVVSNGQLFVPMPLMWQTGLQPLSLPTETQGHPSGAMQQVLHQMASQLVAGQAQQQLGELPAVQQQQAQQAQQAQQQGIAQTPLGSPLLPGPLGAPPPTPSAAELLGCPPALDPSGAGMAGAAGAMADLLAPATGQPGAGGAGVGAGVPASPLPASPSFTFLPGPGAQPGSQLPSPEQLPGALSAQAQRAQQLAQQAAQPLAAPQQGSLVATLEAAAAAGATPGRAAAAPWPAAPAVPTPFPPPAPARGPAATAAAGAGEAPISMDLCPGGAREGGSVGGPVGLTWLQANAVGPGMGMGSAIQPRQPSPEAAVAAAAAAAGLASISPEGSEGGQLPAAAAEGQGPATRKRTRGGGGAAAQQAPPASPRATPTKRKPLRTITSALM